MKLSIISRFVLLNLAASTAYAAGTTSNWTNPAGGSWGTPGNWDVAPIFATDDVLDFSTLDITADAETTLDGNRTVGSLNFGDAITASNNWTVNPGTGGTLTLDVATGSPAITVNNQTATIGVSIAGSDGLTKAGAGTLVLSGASTYSGTTNLSSGTLVADSDTALGTGAISASNGTNLSAKTGKTITLANAFNLIGESTANFGSASNTGNLNLGACGLGGTNKIYNVFSGVTVNFQGTVSQSGSTSSLNKSGTGTLILSGTSTYTVATNVNGGILQFAKQVSLYNNDSSKWLPTNLRISSGGTAAFNVGGTNEFTTGDVTTLLTNLTTGLTNNGFKAGSFIGFDTTNAAGGTFTLADTIGNSTGTGGGALGVTKLGANTLLLSGANTYTGNTNLLGGTLVVDSDTALGTGAITASNGTTLSAMAGKTITLANAFNLSGTSTANFGDATNTGNLNLGAASLGGLAKNFNVLPGVTVNLQGTISQTATSASFTKSGTGTLILSGASTYTVTTRVNGGSLQFAKQVSLYNNDSSKWLPANLTINSGGTAAFNVGGTDEFTTGDVTTLLTNLTTGLTNNGFRSGSSIGFDTTHAAGGNFTFADNIGDSTGTGGGALGVTKLGSNTLVLSGANTYTGNTTVSGGILSVAGANFDDASSVTIASGAKLNLNFAGTDTVGALVINGTTLPDGVYGSSHPTYGSFFTGTGTLTVGSGTTTPGFATWASGLGLSGDPDADFDKDGIADATEYVLGTNPKAASGAGISGQKSGSNFVFTFNRSDDSETSDITLTVEAGTTLGAWPQIFNVGATTATSSAGVVVTENGVAADTVTVTIPTSAATKLFARLKVNVAP